MAISGKILGLAVRERAISAVEVRIARGRNDVVAAAEFGFPEGLSWDKPKELGTALRHFLRQHRFSASRAVVGVPARWLMSREKELPPATPEVACNVLRIQAERDFNPELKGLVFDFIGRPDPRTPRRAMLVAMQRHQLDSIVRMADEAGLGLMAVTSSALTLAAAIQDGESGMSLMLASDAAELVIGGEAAPRMLRHLPIAASPAEGNGHAAAAYAGSIGAEMRKVAALMPPLGTGGSINLSLWDGVGLDLSAASVIGQRSGLAVRVDRDLASLGIGSAPASGNADNLGPAVSLAVAAARESLPLDFLHSRLAAPKKQRINRKTLLYSVVGCLALAVVAALFVDVQLKQRRLDDLKRQLNEIKPEVQAAQAVEDRVRQARGYYDNRPSYLACLREMTLAFPQDGQAWAMSFLLRENMKGQLTGKAVDQRAPLALVDRLNGNKNFANVQLLDMREAGGRTREMTFSIQFTYKGVE